MLLRKFLLLSIAIFLNIYGTQEELITSQPCCTPQDSATSPFPKKKSSLKLACQLLGLCRGETQIKIAREKKKNNF